MDLTMARPRHSPDQIQGKLRDADVLLADGRPLPPITKQLKDSEQTEHRWRDKYDGIKGPERKRRKELDTEDLTGKRLLGHRGLRASAVPSPRRSRDKPMAKEKAPTERTPWGLNKTRR